MGDSETIQITVNDPHLAPIVDAGGDQMALEGEVISFTGTYTNGGLILGGSPQAVGVLWNFGDGTTISGTLSPTHAYPNDGEFIVTLVVTSAFGKVGEDTLLVTVENVLPVVEPLAPEQTVKAGEALTITGSFTDTGLLDAHLLTIAWGDGLTATLELEAGVFDFSISHVYASAGTYTATLTLADEDGETVQTFVVLVGEVAEVGYTISLPLVQK
jgi:PKD repeat protein